MEKRDRKLRFACLRGANSVVLMLAFIVGLIFVGSCAGERAKFLSDIAPEDTTDVIIDHYWESERVLIASATVKDTLVKSDVTFKQVASMKSDKEGAEYDFKFNPSLYLRVRLAKSRIDVKSVADLPVSLLKQQLKSKTPYRNGTTLGADVVREFTFSDGQVATVSYGHRYTGVVQGEDTLATPHLEIDSINFVKALIANFGDKTETEDPYKATLVFRASYSAKGVSEGNELSDKIELQPWYHKVVTSDATEIENVTYTGKYIGCPLETYELTEVVKTNKGEETHVYTVPLSLKVTSPQEREQPSNDSLFVDKSTGKIAEEVFAEVTNEDGFTVQTINGTYTSTATGKEAQTVVESVVNFTYQKPVMFKSEYGSYDIPDIALKFTELAFEVNKTAETDEYKMFKSVNTLYGEIAGCTLDPIDEVVMLKIQAKKPDDVLKVDSTYTLRGDDDEYIVDKEIIWSDGSKTSSTYTYQGRHSASALPFGEVVTTSLSWNENELKRMSQSTTSEEKKFSESVKFNATYTTSNWQANASNGKESGFFSFREMSPVVVFTDGKVVKTFPERKYVMTGIGADVSPTFSTIVRDGVTYKAYPYDYTTKATWNGDNTSNLVSQGWLLMIADEVGDATYTTEQTWNGNTTTVKVIKTTPHSAGEDEVETFTKNFTVEFGKLTYGKLYADNTSFATTETHSTTNTSATDNYWTVRTYSSTYKYTTSNGVVKREQNLPIKDAEIVFDDGTFNHTFNVRLTMSKSERLDTQNSKTEGEYKVTPHFLTVQGQTVDGRVFNSEGQTDIYVKEDASVTSSSKRTIVYNDGTVDFVLEKKMSDGSTQTVKASDTYGTRFAFDFKNTTPQEKEVSQANHTASENLGSPTSSNRNQGSWKVVVKSYPYTHTLSNGVEADKLIAPYSYNNFSATLSDEDLGEVIFTEPSVAMMHKSLNIQANGTSGNFDIYNANVAVHCTASGTEGNYATDLNVTHVLKVASGGEPEDPNFGKPKAFYATATFDPSAEVTRRAFVFQWEKGVTYAVCNYETMLPNSQDFMYKADSYQEYNSVGYKVSSGQWLPAKGVDGSDNIKWFASDGSIITAITDFECATYGWKNVVDGKYELIIPGYSYSINGYNVTVIAPNGQSVTFNSHYEP